MSVKKRLRGVKDLNQLNRRHWKTLGTKLGGVEIVKAFLRGKIRLVPEDKKKRVSFQDRGANHLTYLNSLMVGPTSGKMTVAKATDVFTGHVDVGFRQYGTNGLLRGSKDTQAQAVHIYHVRRPGMFIQLFRSLGDPYGLVLTQGQIVEYCRNHRSQFHSDCGSIFILFMERNVLSVAEVAVSGDKMSIYWHDFSSDVFRGREGDCCIVVSLGS